MEKTQVHITLRDTQGSWEPAVKELQHDLGGEAALKVVDDRQLRRFGIVTAEVAADALPRLRACPAIEAVEAVTPKRISAH